MNIKSKYLFFLLFATTAFGQFVPNYFATLESNRPKGNKYLYYRLYTSSTSTSPASSAEFESSYANAANFKLAGYVALTTNAGNLNTSASYAANLINFFNQTDLKNAIGNQTPYSGFNGDGFAIVVSGYFIPKQTGTYTFSIEGDDAVDLFINDQNVVNHYLAHGNFAVGTHTGTIALIAGKKYLFRARMHEAGGGEVLQVFWKKPSEASGALWYQDIEELSGEEAVSNGLVLSLDPANWYTYPKYGTAVTDLKGNATGTFGGNTAYNTTAQGVFSLDGNADYIDFGKTPTNFPAGDISTFVWLKGITIRANWNIFLTKWFSGSDFHYDLYNNGLNVFQRIFTTSKSDMVGTTPLYNSTWYQVGFTISSGNLQMYVNGAKDGSSISGASRTNQNTANLYIGDPRNNGIEAFNGYIGSVQIYNRALTQEEVFQNYNATKHKYGL